MAVMTSGASRSVRGGNRLTTSPSGALKLLEVPLNVACLAIGIDGVGHTRCSNK